MQSYLATITWSKAVLFVPNGHLTPRGFKFYKKTHIKSYFVKL